MTQFEQLDLLLNEYGGIIQTFQVIDNGISKPVFYSYVKERGLEQAAQTGLQGKTTIQIGSYAFRSTLQHHCRPNQRFFRLRINNFSFNRPLSHRHKRHEAQREHK